MATMDDLNHAVAAANLDGSSPIQRVFAMPVILTTIFQFILADDYGQWSDCPTLAVGKPHRHKDPLDDSECCDKCIHYGCHGVLLRCALVNKFWFDDAIRQLWKRPHIYWHSRDGTLTSHLTRLPPERRQFYSNFVENGIEWTVGGGFRQDHVFEGVKFPRLKTLRVMLDDDYVPKIQGHNIEVLELDPHYEACYPEMYGIVQDDMEQILDQIVEVFPDVRKVIFEDRALAWPGAIAKFRGRMKSLEKFEHDLVMETSERWW